MPPMHEHDETPPQPDALDTVELRRPRHFDWIRTAGMLAVLGLFALVTLQFTPFWPAPENHAGVGSPLPAIDLQPLTADSGPVATADIEGKVVLLNFWGTWCPPCRQEAPHIDALYQTFGGNEGFRLLSVSCSGNP
ncbi:MAG: TlpA family protein disulfide reductase, partial [Planctomycetota bacterium]